MGYAQNIDATMFDFKDYYEKIALWLPDPCRLVEIGVANGASALFLAERLQELGKDFEMYWVDDFSYGGNKQITEVVKNICNSEVGKRITLYPVSSLDAAARFNDNFFDFAFLDSNHLYLMTRAEIMAWWRKVKSDGILAGHDYYLYKDDVGAAVHELIPAVNVYIGEAKTTYVKSIQIYETEQNFGVWEVRKSWQAKLKTDF